MRGDLYEEMARIEESHWWFLGRRKLVDVFIQGGKLLDVGCGTGGNMRRWREKGCQVYGLDESAQAVLFCKKTGLRNVKIGKAENLPYRSDIFDTVTILDVLEHIGDDKKAIKECYRVLKTGGEAIITVPAYSWMWSQWDQILGHKRRYDVNQLSELIKGSGFIQKDIICYFSFVLVPVFIFRKIKMFLGSKDYRSDFREGKFASKILSFLAGLERELIFKGVRLPFGLSVMLVMTK